MQEILDRIQKSVETYDPKTHIKSVRAVLVAVQECLRYIDETSKTDRGCCQRLARDVDQIFWASTHFRKYSGEKDDIISRHTAKLAREHLDGIEKELKQIVAAEEEQKKTLKLDWVKTHPVFHPLQQKTSKSSAKYTYVLLFRRLPDGELELVTKTVPNMLITRFRAREFKESLHVYNSFHNKSIVGAAVIADRDLIATIGELPEPNKNKDLLATLLSISSEVAAKPSKQYVEQNIVLHELHKMTERREIPKEAYILLFRAADDRSDGADPVIVIRPREQDRITTRFWSADFVNARKIIQELGGHVEITGAAIINKNSLLKTLGVVPQASESKTQLQVVLSLSNGAVEQPSIDFLEHHEVFKSLHELANGNFAHSSSYILLFEQSENGKLEVVRPDGTNARLDLADFKLPRKIHDRFSTRRNIVGASVIAEVQSPTPARREAVPKGNSSGPPRRDAPPSSKPSVVAAFGRTPLKINLLATPEILERFGLRI